MKKILSLAVVLLTTFSVFAQTADEKAVVKAFEDYKSAILNDKGEQAAAVADSRTVKYYSEILNLVKTADSAKVASLSILDRLMVFSVRHRTSKKDILSFDGKGLFVYAIKSGMVGKNSVARNTIGTVTIDGDFAKGQFVANGQKTPLDFHFYKEGGVWKIDLTSIFPASTMAVDKMAKDSGKDSNEFIFSLLEIISGKAPGHEIWKPTLLK